MTSEEKFLINHITMFGQDGAPIFKANGVWVVTLGTETRAFRTKREAVAAFDVYYDGLLKQLAVEADAERLVVRRAAYLRDGWLEGHEVNFFPPMPPKA